MEVMNPINFKQVLQEKRISKQYFSYSTSVKDHDFALCKPANVLLHIEQEKAVKFAPTDKKQSHSLIVWGCGEFGQHGLNLNGDVTFEMALSQFRAGEIMLPDGEFPLSSVCGSSHTLVLTGTGQVYSWGNGTSGQLGNGTCLTTIKPTLVPLTVAGKIQGMSCGARHSFIWTNAGYCYSFGNNFNAQLGYNFSKDDFKENQLQPVLVELFPDMKVKEVACGARHSLFLLTTGRVMAVGCNQHGQVGNDTTQDVVIPTMLDDLNSITHVACGNIHSLASHENGAVYAWGYGKAFGNKIRHVISPQRFTPQDIQNSSAISLAGGDCHSMVLYDSGVVYTWGNNYEGQLGVGKEIKYQHEPEPIPGHLLPRPVIQIACGETTSAAVTGTGQLYMWGKNAGLIHSDKPSQYFQYLPCRIDMEGLTVTQVSCGAWHVSAVIKKSTNEMENDPQNLETESYEAEQPTLTDPKLNLAEVNLPCEDRDKLIISEDSTEHRRNNTCRNELLNTELSENSLDNCFKTKYNSQTDIPRENSECNAPDTCFITKYNSSSEISSMDNERYDDAEIFVSDSVKDKKLTEYSEELSLDKKIEDCLVAKTDNSSLYKTEFYGVDKTVWRTNELRNMNSMDSTFGYNCKETYEDSNLSRKHENEFETENAYTIDKQKDPCNTSPARTPVCSSLEDNLTTDFSQPSLTYNSGFRTTEDRMILRKDKGDTTNTVLAKKKTTNYYTSESLNVCNIEPDTKDKITLETDKTNINDNDSLPNESEDFRNDDVLNDHFVGNASNIFKRSGNECLQTYCEVVGGKNVLKNNYCLGNSNEDDRKNDSVPNCSKDDHFQGNDGEFEVAIIENKKANQNSKVKEDLTCTNNIKHWNCSQSLYDFHQNDSTQLTTSLSDKTPYSIAERNISGLSLDALEHMSSIKPNSGVRPIREIRLAISPLQNSTVKQHSEVKRNTQFKVTPTQNRSIDTNHEVFARRQTVPVIDLSFGKAVENGEAEQSRVKPSFTTFRNVWKASSLFKEKQRKLGKESRRRSDINPVFNLESMLPNRPTRAVREIEKWTKLKNDSTHLQNDSTHLQNDSTQELRTKTDKLMKCCHHTGELLPPICSCKKNSVLLKKHDTNVFIDRK